MDAYLVQQPTHGGGGGGVGGAVAAPALTGMTLVASWDFGDASKLTLSSGSIGGGGTITAVAPSDGTAYTLSVGAVGLVSIIANNQYTGQVPNAQYMQCVSDLGLNAAAQCVIVAIVENTATNFSYEYIPIEIGDPNGSYATSRVRLAYSNDYPGIASVKADGSVLVANNPSPVYSGVGPRCLISYNTPGTTATQLYADGQSSPTVSSSTGVFPTGMTTVTVGAALNGGGVAAANGGMNITRLLVYSTAPSASQATIATAITNWAFTNYNAYGKPLAAKTIQRPVIAASSATAGASVVTTAGQAVGFPAATITQALYKNGTLVASNYAGSGYTTTVNGDLLRVDQVASNTSGTDNAVSSLVMTVGATQFVPVVNSLAVVGSKLTVYVPGMLEAGLTVASWQWYYNTAGTNNTTGQVAWSTASQPTYSSGIVGSVPTVTVTLSNGQSFSTTTFGNVLPTNTPGMAVGVPQRARTSPATATRPSGNTGTGLFTRYGEVYDSSGTRISIRGLNATHWDTIFGTGIFNTNMNAMRLFIDFNQTFSTGMTPLLSNCKSNKVIPIPACSTALATFTGSTTTSTLTVTATTMGAIAIGMPIYVGTLSSQTTYVGTISSFGGTGTGGVGTYPLTGGVAQASTTMSGYIQTSGNSDPSVLASCVQNWIDQGASWQAYDKYTIINIANEWGPAATSSNTVWRDSYITAISRMRTAGFTGCFLVDPGSNGQDIYGPLNHFAAILASDPQGNCICALHMYGYYPANTVYTAIKSLSDVSVSTGQCYVIGEFGPGQNIGTSATNAEPGEVVGAADACNIGVIAWAFDDHNASNPPQDNSFFCMVYNWYTGYSTSAATDLLYYGQKYILDPVRGILTTAVKTTVT